MGTHAGGFEDALGLAQVLEDLVYVLEEVVVEGDLVYVLQGLVMVEGQVCVVEDLCQEGFVGLEVPGFVPGLLLPLVALMEDFALGFFSLEGFSMKGLLSLLGQLLWFL